MPRLANGAPNVARLLTWQHVRAYLDMGKNSAIKVRKLDPRFPKPISLPGVHERYDVKELEAYVEQLKAERDSAA